MKCIADVHYEVVHGVHAIKALRCAFCPFTVLRANTPQPLSSRSGLGRYNRMRGKMVRHLHACHRDALRNDKARRSLIRQGE